MIFGVWDPDQCKAIVKVCKGNHLDTMGVRGRMDTLFPEEMLFLVEKSRMCLFLASSTSDNSTSNEQPASIEECYALLLSSGVKLEEYLVYAHLKSLGNVLFRRGVIKHEWTCGGLQSIGDFRIWEGFEVWTPKEHFSRKSCPMPSFLLLIDTSRSCQREHVEFLKRSLEVAKAERTPVKLACVVDGGVDFFNHSIATVAPM